MKRCISFILALSLTFDFFAPTFIAAAEAIQEQQENTPTVEEKQEADISEEENKAPAIEEAKEEEQNEESTPNDEEQKTTENQKESTDETLPKEPDAKKEEGPTPSVSKESKETLDKNDSTDNKDTLQKEIYHIDGIEATGNLEIDIKFVLPIKNVENSNIAVILKDQEGNQQKLDFNGITEVKQGTYNLGSQKGEVSIRKLDKEGSVLNGLSEEDVKYYSITIYHLKKGTYTIELAGNGYKTYAVKDVKLDTYAKRVTITNETGMFEAGDVNKDNTVNDSDINDIIRHIDSTVQSDILKYDLNRDGKIDITDIAITASTINQENRKESILDTSVMIDASNIKVESILEGEAKNLFQEEGSVTVKPEKQNEEISESNPAILSVMMERPNLMSQIRIDVGVENKPEEIILEIEDEKGKISTFKGGLSHADNIHYFTDKASADTIVIDLLGQVAVKKVTIKITKTSSKKLADITEVEFLNNVYEEVPAPKMEFPKNIKVEIGSEQANVTFDNLPNVTGYEILVQTLENGQITENIIYQTSYTTYEIKGLENYTTYQVSIRAVNGEWKSAYSNTVEFMPIPNRKPPKVDMVVANAVYGGINVSWKDMKDTTSYNLFYKKESDSEYQVIKNINGCKYSLMNLEGEMTYQIYLTGNNDLGEGPGSEIAVAKTLAHALPDLEKFGLINTSNGIGVPTAHIKSVTYGTNSNNASEFALVDNSYDTFWQANTWDVGGYNAGQHGPTFTFDKEYTMDHIFLVANEDTPVVYISLRYVENGETKTLHQRTVSTQTSPNGQRYYRFDFSPITTSQVQVSIANNAHTINKLALREILFYYYNPLMDDIGNLFLDDLRVELKENVTLADIEALEERANTIDEVSGEYHPFRKTALSELEYARKILNDTALHDSMIVDQNFSTSKNGHLGFSSLSDLQPLGVSVRAGEEIAVYVGTTGNVLPQLVFTQYYAEASVWKQVVNLKKGQNIIIVPKIGSMDKERGGSIYVRYPNSKPSGEIKVRVSGGVKIPTLDVHTLTNRDEIRAKVATYIDELEIYNQQLPEIYQKEGSTFDKATSVLNVTEIGTKNGLFSVAATSAYDGIKASLTSKDQMVDRLTNSLIAFEEMMGLFYRHKGLSENATNAKDKTPASRVNIRAMRMFDGAFMYASGDHVGVGHGSVPGLMQGRPNTNENGTISTTGYFGWGISHEIGHQINQGAISYAEVTNNVFSLLAQTNDDKATSRIEAKTDKIYQKVTSNTFGKSSDVFTTLGMYWQLHLAYDDTLTINDTNSIYARMNKIMRNQPLSGYTKDELTVLYASIAAERDLTEFFEKWGIVITDKVKAYMKENNLEKETRAIYYLNDDARRYRRNGGTRMDSASTVSATMKLADNQNKRYTLSFQVENNTNTSSILGYEIKRNGVVIAFVRENEFTDNIGTLNNQALTYEVTAYDKLLNKTASVKLDEVKVSHDGSIPKDNFTISSNMMEENESIDHENPEMNYEELKMYQAIDGDITTIFNGTKRVNKNDKTAPYLIIDMNRTMDIAGIKYRAATNNGVRLENTMTKYKVYVSRDRENWTLAKQGTFTFNENHEALIYFDKEGTTGGNQLWTYSDIGYIKIESIGGTGISAAEIDVIAPPGDNVEMTKDGIGVLASDYVYRNDQGEEERIQAGSVIFKGDYRGNPAFNVVLLVDADTGELLCDSTTGCVHENFLFASLDNNGNVDEIASGTWFYVVDKDSYESFRNRNVRAELYRVDDALSNDGQRLTSTSMRVSKDDLKPYENLPSLEIVDSTKGETK